MSENYKMTTSTNGNRNLIGNMNDNEIVIKKCFTHANNYKRARALMNQSTDEITRMKHELSMYHEFDALELTLRTLQSNIRRDKYNNDNDNE